MNRQAVQHTIALLAIAASVVALPFSVKLCHASVILFLINWLIDTRWKERWVALKSNFLIQVFIAFFLFHLIGMLYTEDIANGWFDLEKKLFMVLIPLAIATSVKFNKKEIFTIVFLFVGACLAATLFCLLQASHQTYLLLNGSFDIAPIDYLSSSPYRDLNSTASDVWMLFSYSALASGIHLHPTYFSLYLAFCIIFMLHIIQKGEMLSRTYTILLWILVTYFSLYIIFLSSRIIIVSILIIFIIRITKTQTAKWKAVPYSLTLIIAFSLLIYFNPITRYRSFQEMTSVSYQVKPNQTYSTSTEIRNSLWWLGLKSMENTNLLWGAGTGSVPNVMQQTSEQYRIKNILQTADPHNQYLHTLISHGVIGIVLLLVCLGIPLYMSLRFKDYLTLTFIILIATTSLTETTLGLQKGIVFFSLFYSLIIFQYRSHYISILPTKQ